MSPTSAAEFGAGYWEDRYRTGTPTSAHDPSPSLVTEAADLEPGSALDAGCGTGADARWLASRGWRVTAVDVSASAIGLAERAAGPQEAVEWVCADLTDWVPGRRFDLVSSQYVHVPGPMEALVARLAYWVGPGGTLLVVGHDAGVGGQAHAHPEGAQVRLDQVTAALPPDEWELVVAGPRTSTVRRAGSPDTVSRADVVVRARRRVV